MKFIPLHILSLAVLAFIIFVTTAQNSLEEQQVLIYEDLLCSLTLNESAIEHSLSNYKDRPAAKACDEFSKLPFNFESNENEPPWMAVLGYIDDFDHAVSFKCGGTLISNLFVLTSDNCVKAEVPVLVRLGKHQLSDEDDFNAINYNIQSIYRHPRSSSLTQMNDIALIRVRQTIEFTKHIYPACLETEIRDQDLSAFTLALSYNPQTDEIRQAQVETLPIKECCIQLLEYNKQAKLGALRDGVSGAQYCAYDLQKDNESCKLSSGGPLQYKKSTTQPIPHIIGVSSFILGCSNSLPNIFTRVAYYLDWIESHVWPTSADNAEDGAILIGPQLIKPNYLLRSDRPTAIACRRYSNLPIDLVHPGDVMQSKELPWMAALVYLDKVDYTIRSTCGGTLISNFYVLTADHCVRTHKPVVVRLGKNNVTDEQSIEHNYQIERIYSHPDSSFLTQLNDIALIKVLKEVQFSELVYPACLEFNLKDRDLNLPMILTDYNYKSNELFKMRVHTLPLEECNRTLLEYNKKAKLTPLTNGLSQNQRCAYDPQGGSDVCKGGNGGPLQYFPTNQSLSHVIGVFSFGVECNSYLPQVYTRITHYLDWIEPIVWPEIKTN